MTNQLWSEAISIHGLSDGWHLTRLDTQKDFITDELELDSFAYSLDINIKELNRQLLTNTYQVKNKVNINVPKTNLSTRPCSHLSIEDRVVLWSIIKKISNRLDSLLNKTVYSYRLTNSKNIGLYNEESLSGVMRRQDITRIYLKRQAILNNIDPFDAWYKLWPKFESKSKRINNTGYNYLLVTDISAYFENISLPILRDILLKVLHNEHKIVNFIFTCLETWAVSTSDGFRPLRGIPQGSGIMSALGNIYLYSIDKIFEQEINNNNDIKYIRYMDDIRIFTKNRDLAKKAIFKLEEAVRNLHLNLQSSKTLILSDKQDMELTNFIHDNRMDKIDHLIKSKPLTHLKNKITTNKLINILKEVPLNPSCKPCFPPPQKLDNLTSRTSRRILALLVETDYYECDDYIFQYIREHLDYRFINILEKYIKHFPNNLSLQNNLVNFLISNANVSPYQEAKIIKAIRYFSEFSDSTKKYLTSQLFSNESQKFYVRIEIYKTLARCKLENNLWGQLYDSINIVQSEKEIYNKLHLLSNQGEANLMTILQKFENSANVRIAQVGKHIHNIHNSYSYSKKFTGYIITPNHPYRINDYLGIIPFALFSDKPEISKLTKTRLRRSIASHPCLDIKLLFQKLIEKNK